MMIHHISTYLQRFDVTEPAALEMDEEAHDEPQAELEEPRLSLAEVETIRRDLEADFAQRLQAQQEAHEQSLSLMREEWTRAESEALSQRFLQALATAFIELRTDVARVIRPFLDAALQERALDELVHAVRKAIRDTRDPVLRLTGPADLIEKVGLALGADAAVNFVESRDGDVSVDLSPLKIETRLIEWRDRLGLEEEARL